MPIHLEKVRRVTGFAATNSLSGQPARILMKAALTSEEPMFHLIMESIGDTFFGRAKVLPDAVLCFVLVFHAGDTADLYVNQDVNYLAEVRAKRNAKAGEVVYLNDIADIRRIKLVGIPLVPSDGVLFCAKVGWKFLLYFDLKEEPRDFDAFERELAGHYRRMTFEHVYKSIETASQFEQMLNDGWFPFVEIIGREYREIARAYADRFNFDGRIAGACGAFTHDRLAVVTARWWSSPHFAAKRRILEAGIEAYLANTPSGDVQCVKTMVTEIEGLLRFAYAADTGKTEHVKTPELTQHVRDRELRRSGDGMSLLLPDPFHRYLTEVVFSNFSVGKGDLAMSRNTAGHGVARPDDYTHARALQAILTIDQLWFSIADFGESPPAVEAAVPATGALPSAATPPSAPAPA
jgi:hypothetical protein